MGIWSELKNIHHYFACVGRRGLLRKHHTTRRKDLHQILAKHTPDHLIERRTPSVPIADVEREGATVTHHFLAIERGRYVDLGDLDDGRRGRDRRPLRSYGLEGEVFNPRARCAAPERTQGENSEPKEAEYLSV